jgi:hypothetical protein
MKTRFTTVDIITVLEELQPVISRILSPTTGSCSFRQWPSRCQQNFFCSKFICLLPRTYWRFIYIILHRKKVIKKSENSSNRGFSYYFCLMIGGSGSVPLTNGSGSGRSKHLRIIRIQITASKGPSIRLYFSYLERLPQISFCLHN